MVATPFFVLNWLLFDHHLVKKGKVSFDLLYLFGRRVIANYSLSFVQFAAGSGGRSEVTVGLKGGGLFFLNCRTFFDRVQTVIRMHVQRPHILVLDKFTYELNRTVFCWLSISTHNYILRSLSPIPSYQ